MPATMKQEYISMYRHTMLEMYRESGMSTRDANEAYRKHAKDHGINEMTGSEVKDATVDRLLQPNGPSWANVRDAYMQDSRHPDMAEIVVDGVYAATNAVAYEDAMSGDWNSVNDKYLTDEQRDAVQLRESEANEDRAYTSEEVAVEKTSVPYVLETNKKGVVYVHGEMADRGDVYFKQTFGSHTFEDDEIQRLLNGEEVTIPLRSGETGKVALGNGTYMGRPYFGVQRTDTPQKAARPLPDVPGFDHEGRSEDLVKD